jgi:MobA/MobL family
VALLRFRREVYKSGGRQAIGRVSYITRQPVRAVSPAAQQLRYISEAREDCLFTTSKNLPAWARGNPYVFFQAAEQHERANGIAFEEWKIALPQELSHRDNMALTRDLVAVIAGDRFPMTYALHDPRTMDGVAPQPHLHLLISARQNDGLVRTPSQHFRRYNPQHPERGGARKADSFRHFGAVKAHRVLIADVINLHLERAGCKERVHPETLERRGMDRPPEPKLLPSESRAYREAGQVSPRMQEVLAMRAVRQHTRAHEQEDARTYWEERKVALGITDTLDMPAQLAKICTARAHVREYAPVRQMVEGMVGVERDDHALGDLAGEAVRHAQAEAQALWGGVQDLADAWQLTQSGRERVEQARTAARDVWREVGDEQRLRDLGNEAADDAWRDAVLLWAEEQGARALRDVGWEAVQEAREEGHEALDAAWQERWQRLAQAQAWPNLAQDLEALARQLDALDEEEGGTGRVRVQLWDRERGSGMGLS